ncbi:MAG: InlB B-repeat-containing protein, partial [Synergistaceae bacterium]|nr:InlB B-repeat-containing protein [Synergistaceae bacterium]
MKRFCGILLFLLLLTLGSSGCGSSNKGSLSSSTTFTVTFDSNGGSEVSSVTVTSGDTVEKPTDPVKEGYYFGNWFRDNGTFQNAFNFGSDKVSADITLYARWLDSNDLMAEYAVGEIVIGYATGDNPKYVTQNLTLPTKVDSSDIAWASSSGAISSNGTVTRQTTDTDVTLTATASYNGKSANRTFELKVIKKRIRDNSKIQSLPLETASSGDISITRNESGDVVDIEGNYATFNIENADDAIDAVTVIKDELGIKNPIEELVPAVITSDKYGAEYQFQQVHNGVKVYGRGVMASANAKGNGDFLHSNLLPSDIISKADGKNDIGKTAAENAAKNYCPKNFELSLGKADRIIYSLESCDNDPVYTYVVDILGISNDIFFDEKIFVNAETGIIIKTSSNVYGVGEIIWENGINELGDPVSFPVWRYTDGKYYLRDPELGIDVFFAKNFYNAIKKQETLLWTSIDEVIYDDSRKITYDAHTISAYTNLREIMQWWKNEFQRDFLNFDYNISHDQSNVWVITHNSTWVSAPYINMIGWDNFWKSSSNALWSLSRGIMVGDNLMANDLTDGTIHTRAAAIDILTHETAHAVITYDTELSLGTNNITGAINEGYADIFGCLKDHNWKIGENIYPQDSNKCGRNIANPSDSNANEQGASKISELGNYDRDIHNQSLIVSHAAYLMHEKTTKNGLTWDELGQVWYKSLRMG